MTVKTLEFNSGRYYGPGGQQIRAMLVLTIEDEYYPHLAQNKLYLDDETRGITLTKGVDFSELTAENVMQAYDAGGYENYPSFVFEKIWTKLTEVPNASI